MTRPLFVLWLLVAAAFGALAMSIVLIHPAFAQECYTLDHLSADVAQHAPTDSVIGTAAYPGDHSDAIVVVERKDKGVYIWLFRQGCAVNILPLDSEGAAVPAPSSAEPLPKAEGAA